MRHLRVAGESAVLGLLIGAGILGVGGRLLMHVVALATRASGGFTWGGSLEVVAAGTGVGLAGGLLLLLIPERLGRWRGLVHGAALLALVSLTSSAARSATSAVPSPSRLPVLLAFAGLLLTYSQVLIWSQKARRASRTTPTP